MRNCTQSREQVNTQRRRERERERVAQHAGRGARILARLQGRVILHYEWLSLKASSQYRDRAASYRCIRLSVRACVPLHLLAVPFLPSTFFHHLPPRDHHLGEEKKVRSRVESSRVEMMIDKDRYFEK